MPDAVHPIDAAYATCSAPASSGLHAPQRWLHRSIGLIAAFILMTFAPVAFAQITAGPVSVMVLSSGKCLNVNGNSPDDLAPIIQWACDRSLNALWTLEPFEDGYHIKAAHSGKCLNVNGNSPDPGAAVIQFTCVPTANELWYIERQPGTEGYRLRVKHSGQCLDLAGGENLGAPLIQYPCNGAANQTFVFSGQFVPPAQPVRLALRGNGLCADVRGGSVDAGADIIQFPCKSRFEPGQTTNQEWTLERVGAHYQIVSRSSAQCIDVFGGSPDPGAAIIQWPCSQANNQLWDLAPQAAGGFTVKSVSSGHCLDSLNDDPVTALQQQPCAATPTQIWRVASEHDLGAWGPLITLPLVPVGAANLANGKVMFWSAFDTLAFTGGNGGETQTALFDPATDTAVQSLVVNTQHDMFCPGTAMLNDGRLLISGGNSSNKTSIYDAAANTWSTSGELKVPRGYQSNVPLDNGSVFSIGGSWSGGQGGKVGEVWAPGGSWTLRSGLPAETLYSDDPQGVFRWDNHAWLFATGGGNVFAAGPSAQMTWYNTSGNGTYAAAGNRGDDLYSMNGNAVMHGIGQILKLGGANAYENAGATKSAYVIDLNAGVTTTKVGPLAHARSFANSVVLPDGRVVVSGGQTFAKPFSDSQAVLASEVFNPATNAFAPGAAMDVPRTYHSIALLLPDGRVMQGGGGLCGGCDQNHLNVQMYTPDYLFQGNGQLAVRPEIQQAPASATFNAVISVSTNRPVAAFSLVRLASVTHSVNNDQRRVPLTITAANGTTYSVKTPANSGVATPGYYMLFAMDDRNVPSVAKMIQVQ